MYLVNMYEHDKELAFNKLIYDYSGYFIICSFIGLVSIILYEITIY
jgi:hypothetical protein